MFRMKEILIERQILEVCSENNVKSIGNHQKLGPFFPESSE